MTRGESADVLDLGRLPFAEALAIQRELHASVANGDAPPTFLVVEHDAVITLGRAAKREHLLLSDDELARRGIAVVATERGGDVTYHGPGQIVVYPIVRLERFREVVPFVAMLERAVVDTLDAFGVAAKARKEHRGVYVGENAICAIGLAVKRMTTMHGLALNVSIPLDYDRLITPCGTAAFGITSIENEIGRTVSRTEALAALIPSLERATGSQFEIP